jgi:hypothetical protein
MAKAERVDERAMVEQDKQTLTRALTKMRKQKRKTAGDRQIEERLEDLSGAQDLGDPQRYHGS